MAKTGSPAGPARPPISLTGDCMRFEVRAIKAPQGVTAFSLEAADGAAALSEVKARGYTVLDVKPHALRYSQANVFRCCSSARN